MINLSKLRARSHPLLGLACLGAGGLLAFSAGCAKYEATRIANVDARPASGEVVADWNDLDAAIDVGARGAELAPLGRVDETPAKGRRRAKFSFVSSDDRTVELVVTQSRVGAGDTSPGLLVLEATGHPFRDAARERELLDGVVKRLKALAGREWAPLAG